MKKSNVQADLILHEFLMKNGRRRRIFPPMLISRLQYWDVEWIFEKIANK